jgi:hypothetical protein
MTGRSGRALEGPPGRIHREAAVMVICTMQTETCESCGREFGCGARDDACWCRDVALGPERLAILREHFERCLCPDCLTVAAGSERDRMQPG